MIYGYDSMSNQENINKSRLIFPGNQILVIYWYLTNDVQLWAVSKQAFCFS